MDDAGCAQVEVRDGCEIIEGTISECWERECLTDKVGLNSTEIKGSKETVVIMCAVE